MGRPYLGRLGGRGKPLLVAPGSLRHREDQLCVLVDRSRVAPVLLVPAIGLGHRAFWRLAYGAGRAGYRILRRRRVPRHACLWANPHFLGLFALGILGAFIVNSSAPRFDRIRSSKGWGWLALAAFAVVVAMMLVFGYQMPKELFPILDLPVGIMAFAVLVFTSLHSRSWLTAVLNFRPLVFIGTFSYSVYLIHAPLLQLLWQYVLHPLGLPKPWLFGTLMSAGAATIIGASYLFFKVCEEPFMRRRSSAPVSRPATAPVAS